MTDTSPEVAQIVREKLMSRSAEERFLMGIEMFEVARAIVDASLPSELSAAERRQRSQISIRRARFFWPATFGPNTTFSKMLLGNGFDF